ncbi:MAG: lipoyl synthase [Nitrospinae bacterium]|nr:lipoyl synthase [Nitrospinota bacterium]
MSATDGAKVLGRRLPPWLRKKRYYNDNIHEVKSILRAKGLHTVCESARCPNISECFSSSTATFMILGDICTRNCRFCAVSGGTPDKPAEDEAERIAEVAGKIGLRHVVVTSVTRDDLEDGGAQQFAKVIMALQGLGQDIVVEVLTPDFKGDSSSIKIVVESSPDIYNHNLETVPRLYDKIRLMADYERSLRLLSQVKAEDEQIVTKSGIMLGLGENQGEVLDLLRDLRGVGVDMVTIGQYIQPTAASIPVDEYIEPALFEWYEGEARGLGFRGVASSPFVRSSYHAQEVYEEIITNNRK